MEQAERVTFRHNVSEFAKFAFRIYWINLLIGLRLFYRAFPETTTQRRKENLGRKNFALLINCINAKFLSRILGVIGCKFVFVLPYCNKKLELGGSWALPLVFRIMVVRRHRAKTE